MEKINLTYADYINLVELYESDVTSTEAMLFYDPKKKYVLKYYYDIINNNYKKKKEIIGKLNANKEIVNIKELVIPSAVASVNNEEVGFVMPFVEGENMQKVMKNPAVSLEKKISYLKKVGTLLKKLNDVRENTIVKDIFLNDLHEGNIIIKDNSNEIFMVDTDSIQIGNIIPLPAKYLLHDNNLNLVSKYKPTGSTCEGAYYASSDTDIYCYILMIFNLIYGDNISKISIDNYFKYLEYLKKFGISQELLDIFSYIYTSHPNENPYEYLDELINVYGRANHNVFKLVKSK